MRSRYVTVAIPLTIRQKRYQRGDVVELEDAAARRLLRAGYARPAEAPAEDLPSAPAAGETASTPVEATTEGASPERSEELWQ